MELLKIPSANAKELRLREDASICGVAVALGPGRKPPPSTPRWDFHLYGKPPQPEHLEQLRAHMESALHTSLFDLCFHADVKFHIKALDVLYRYIAGAPTVVSPSALTASSASHKSIIVQCSSSVA